MLPVPTPAPPAAPLRMPPSPDSSPTTPADFLLVLPAYRELNRLPRFLDSLTKALAPAPWATEILVVDDGSPGDEQKALAALIVPVRDGHCQVLAPRLLAHNRLKGDAILEGWRSRPARWLAFADADGAAGAEEVLRVFGDINSRDPSGASAYFADRHGPGKSANRRTPSRRFLSSLFSALAGFALRVPPIDFQCGFKVVPGSVLPRIADRLEGRGLCFDLALFVALRSEGVPVRQFPVTWRDQPEGKVSPWRNGPAMLAGLWKLAVRGAKPKTRP